MPMLNTASVDLKRAGLSAPVRTIRRSAKPCSAFAVSTIVLTGALSPARFKSTDAVFNIGMAIAAVQTVSPGVYLAMNGQVFAAGAVRKNRAENRFELTN